MAAAPGVVWAQLSGEVSLVSDYRYRGESFSDRRPALQAGLDYQSDSGLFAGAFASTVRLGPDVSGLGGQLYAGYADIIDGHRAFDVGVVTHLFPSSAREPAYAYTEAFAGMTAGQLGVRAYYSDDYFGAGGRAGYLELDGTHAVDGQIVLVSHLGYLTHHRSRSAGVADQGRSVVDAKAGLAVSRFGLTLELSVVGSSARKNACPAGTGLCGPALVFELSRHF